MRVAAGMLALVASLMIVGSVFADDEKTAPEGRRPHHPMMGRMDPFQSPMLKDLSLTDDQKAKVEALKKEYGPKLDEQKAKVEQVLKDSQALHKEVREKITSLLTPEQKDQLKKEFVKHRRPRKVEVN